MGLHLGELIIGRIFASFGGYFYFYFFLAGGGGGGLIIGILRYIFRFSLIL